MSLLGDFNINDGINPEGTYLPTDPINANFKIGTPKFTAGFRLKLAIVTLNFDYTVQQYQSFNMGFGFSFRENDSGTF